LLLSAALAACSGSDGNGGAGGSTAVSSESLQRCVDDINQYRATLGRPAYARSSALEAYASAGAESDGQSGNAHGHFGATSGGNGIAFAENEVPGWPGKSFGGLNGVIDGGLKAMWDEGPGGGHYDNMASTSYTSVGCGTYTTSTGDIWVTIDFK
jgi:uncharacterized protein YkwD